MEKDDWKHWLNTPSSICLWTIPITFFWVFLSVQTAHSLSLHLSHQLCKTKPLPSQFKYHKNLLTSSEWPAWKANCTHHWLIQVYASVSQILCDHYMVDPINSKITQAKHNQCVINQCTFNFKYMYSVLSFPLEMLHAPEQKLQLYYQNTGITACCPTDSSKLNSHSRPECC